MPISIDSTWLSNERFANYLDAAGQDIEVASRLYEWNAASAAALFELIGHFEVILRNRIIIELGRAGNSPTMVPGTPWVQGHKQIDEVVHRLKRTKQPLTAGRIYAGLTFGFWRSLFGSEYEELWRHSLKYVFRHSRADRKVIAAYLESINQMRNRLAHHGSLLDYDIEVEARKLFRLAGWIDPKAEEWLRSLERVSDLKRDRPLLMDSEDTMLVADDGAWRLYKELKQNALVFPVGQSVRLPEYLAFYADNEIKPVIPKRIEWYDAIDWNIANAKRLRKSSDPQEKALGDVIAATIANGWKGRTYQVFLLTGPTDPSTVQLEHAISHREPERGNSLMIAYQYVKVASLRSAKDVAELM